MPRRRRRGRWYLGAFERVNHRTRKPWAPRIVSVSACLYPHSADLDIHKDTIVAGVRHMVGGTVRRAVRTFKTTKDLIASSEWLAAEDCTRIAMEATGIYGSQCGTFWALVRLRCLWPRRPTSRTCRAAKPT